MPTAARLIAALCLAALGWYVSELIKPLFDPDKAFGRFSVINAGLGLVIGWTVIGGRAGRGMTAAMNNGLTGGAVLVFWGLLIQGGYKMFQLSTRGRYDGAFEAGADVFNRMAEFGVMMLTPAIVSALVVGAALAGVIPEMVHRRANRQHYG